MIEYGFQYAYKNDSGRIQVLIGGGRDKTLKKIIENCKRDKSVLVAYTHDSGKDTIFYKSPMYEALENAFVMFNGLAY
jgi:hypothetical protein